MIKVPIIDKIIVDAMMINKFEVRAIWALVSIKCEALVVYGISQVSNDPTKTDTP